MADTNEPVPGSVEIPAVDSLSVETPTVEPTPVETPTVEPDTHDPAHISDSEGDPPVAPSIVEQIAPTPETVAAAVDAISDPATHVVDLEATPSEAVAAFQEANPVPVAPDPSGDPFPEQPWPEFKQVLVGASGGSHGGFIRHNLDGSVSFKPTSYLGSVETAEDVEVLAGRLP